MARKGGKRGRILTSQAPEWKPLLELAESQAESFMWMHAVELEDGTLAQAYKHRWTRRYLLLASNRRAFVEVERGRYEEVRAAEALLGLLEEEVAEFGYYFVPQNEPDTIQLHWARSATKHRISRGRSRHVIERCRGRFRKPAPDAGGKGPRVLFLGDDARGVALEIVAVEIGTGSFLVIHAMEMRRRYRELYERGRRWPRT